MTLNIISSALSVSGKGIIILSKNCIITLLFSLISCTVTQRPTQALNFTFTATSMHTGNDFLNNRLSRCLKARPQAHSTCKDPYLQILIVHQLLLGERQASKSLLTLKNKSIGNGQWVFILYTDFMYAEHTTLAIKTLKADLWENRFTVTVGIALKHGRNCGGVCNQVHIWQISPIYLSRVQSAQATLGNGPKYHLLFVGKECVPPDKCTSPWSNTYLHCKLSNFMSSR